MRPAFKVVVNGSDITGQIADRLIRLSVTDEAGVKSDRVEITLDDRDQRLSIPPKKATLTVAIGYSDQLVNKGTFTVDEIELEGPERRMTIRATATGASRGAKSTREKSYHETTLGKIAAEVAKRNKWELKIAADLSKIEVPHADQTENDLQFMTRLAVENGAVAKVAHGKLVVAAHGEGKTTSGKSVATVTINASQTVVWSMTDADRGDYKGVKAKYHDLKKAETGSELDGEDDDSTHTLPHTYATKASAKRAAKAKRTAVQKAKQKFSIRNMPGNANLQAEGKLNAVGFRSGVDGQWTINSVSHEITDAGYTCSLDCEK